MSTCLRASILSLSVVGLAACASTGPTSATAYVAPPPASAAMDVDEAYIARVQQIARRRGVEVVWVNMPRKPAAKTE